MTRMDHQAEANQKSEAGMFYPTGYIVSGFADSDTAHKAQQQLRKRGFGEADVKYVAASEMKREAGKNLENPSFFASTGASMPTRQKQLELANEGYEFVMIYAPEDEDEQRAIQALSTVAARYAVKYKRLIIENLMPQIPGTSGGEAPRVS